MKPDYRTVLALLVVVAAAYQQFAPSTPAQWATFGVAALATVLSHVASTTAPPAPPAAPPAAPTSTPAAP